MRLINERVLAKLEELEGFCFIGNSILDNCVYQLDVKFMMPRTSDIFHKSFSHKLPLLADDITDYASARGVYLHRPVVPANVKDYENTKEIFDDIFSYMKDLEGMISEAVTITEEESDLMTEAWLKKFLIGIIPFTKMALDMVDYIEANGHTSKDNMNIDARVDKFLKTEEEEGED